jgi:CRP-like cAMP-binding protein
VLQAEDRLRAVRESTRVREGEFIRQLQALLDAPVAGLGAEAKARVVAAALARMREGHRIECRFVPFVPGRRPIDEGSYPGLGSSDHAALVLGPGGADGAENTAYLLFDVVVSDPMAVAFEVSLCFAGPDGSADWRAIPGWERRPLGCVRFASGSNGRPALRAIELGVGQHERLVLALFPEHDLFPGGTWRWEELDPQLRDGATDAGDPYTFGHLFAQQLRVELRMIRGEAPVAADQADVFTCDIRRVGSLYQRLIDRLIASDAGRQAAAAGMENLDPAFHPWYPVLLIGTAKAALYTRALIGDIVHKRRNLTDPEWLLRVGLYLEFLTCLGIVEAVREQVGDLLTPAERSVFERSVFFAEIRRRINPGRWREVWKLRTISFRGHAAPRAGPVSARNLLCKRRATSAFLEAHHEDLRHAIELAGPNHHNAQETWQRVFRDAERAVLQTTPAAFPELDFLPSQVRDFVLWHRRGHLSLERAISVPRQISALLGDQDGLFASACTQYRLSMNAVAAWSKERLLMDFTGSECIPREASLLETKFARPARVAELQHRDGYEESLELTVELPERYERSVEDVQRLLAAVPAFACLTIEELQELARTARPITLGPMERLIVQGQRGESLFVIADGAVEVMLRRRDGRDWPIDTLTIGAVIGEMSLLTGEPRAATVRAIESVTVYEIGRRQYEPLLRSRPQLLDELAALVEQRLRTGSERLSAYDAERERRALRARIGRFLIPDRAWRPASSGP